MSAMTLTEFLLARIAEDEAIAQSAIDPTRPGTHWQWVTYATDRAADSPTWEDGSISLRTVEEFPTIAGYLPAFVLNAVEVDEPRGVTHIARHDPARVLAECEAKRRIIRTVEGGLRARTHRKRYRDAYIDWAEYVLRLIAVVYADHPDYQEEWRP